MKSLPFERQFYIYDYLLITRGSFNVIGIQDYILRIHFIFIFSGNIDINEFKSCIISSVESRIAVKWVPVSIRVERDYCKAYPT